MPAFPKEAKVPGGILLTGVITAACQAATVAPEATAEVAPAVPPEVQTLADSFAGWSEKDLFHDPNPLDSEPGQNFRLDPESLFFAAQDGRIEYFAAENNPQIRATLVFGQSAVEADPSVTANELFVVVKKDEDSYQVLRMDENQPITGNRVALVDSEGATVGDFQLPESLGTGALGQAQVMMEDGSFVTVNFDLDRYSDPQFQKHLAGLVSYREPVVKEPTPTPPPPPTPTPEPTPTATPTPEPTLAPWEKDSAYFDASFGIFPADWSKANEALNIDDHATKYQEQKIALHYDTLMDIDLRDAGQLAAWGQAALARIRSGDRIYPIRFDPAVQIGPVAYNPGSDFFYINGLDKSYPFALAKAAGSDRLVGMWIVSHGDHYTALFLDLGENLSQVQGFSVGNAGYGLRGDPESVEKLVRIIEAVWNGKDAGVPGAGISAAGRTGTLFQVAADNVILEPLLLLNNAVR